MSMEKADISRRNLFLGATAAAGAMAAGLASKRALATTQATETTTQTTAVYQAYSFNVTDFGADLTGVSDSTQAFHAAVAAAAAAAAGKGGGRVLVPGGLYKLSQTITLPTYVSLCGPGTPHSATLDFSTQQSGPGIRVTGFGHVGIEGLCIANTAGNGVEIHEADPKAPYKNFCHLRDVWVLREATDSTRGGSGFVVSNTYMTTFERCWVKGVRDFGFHLTGFHTSLKLDTCWAQLCGNTGFNLNATVYSTLNNCGADENGGYGYFLANCQGVTLSGCGAEDNYYSSIGMAATDAWAAGKKEAEGELRGITITSFFSLRGNRGRLVRMEEAPDGTKTGIYEPNPGFGSYMTLYTENSRKIEGSSLNHFVYTDPRGVAEVSKSGFDHAQQINFPVQQGSRVVA